MRVVGGGDDGSVCLWEAADGTLLQQLSEHHGMVASEVWSSDGARLASAGGGRDSGELFVWDVQSRERVCINWPFPSPWRAGDSLSILTI